MSDRKSLLFVVNPISGGKSKKRLPLLIKKYLNHRLFTFEIYWWEQIDDLPNAIEIFKEKNGYAVVAVGGDGTINAIANCLINMEVRLAMIPQGSGNGFAREFKISRSVTSAIRQLNHATETKVDVGKINDRHFINVAGWGFDAKVSNTFSKLEKRGFWSYAKAISTDFGGARNLHYTVQTSVETLKAEGFLMTIANGRQWGNNFFVAPKASFIDGKLDLVFMRKPKLYQVPVLVFCLYFRLPSKLLTSFQVEHGTIQSDKPCYTHVDGEPLGKVESVDVEVLPKALRVLV